MSISLEVGEGQKPSPAQLVEARNQYMHWCTGHQRFHPEKEFGLKRGTLDSQCREWRNVKHRVYLGKPENKEKAAQRTARYSTGTTAARIRAEDTRARAIKKLQQKPTKKLSLSRARIKVKRVRTYVKSRPKPAICAAELVLGNKWCSACFAFRPLTSFGACKTTHDKLQNRCNRNHKKMLLVPAKV